MSITWLLVLFSFLGLVVAFFWYAYPPCTLLRWWVTTGPLAVLVNQWILEGDWLDEHFRVAFALGLACIASALAVCLLPRSFFVPILAGYVSCFTTLPFPWPVWLLGVAIAIAVHALIFCYADAVQLIVMIYSLCLSALIAWQGYYTVQAYEDQDYQDMAYPLYLLPIALGLLLTRLFYLAQFKDQDPYETLEKK